MSSSHVRITKIEPILERMKTRLSGKTNIGIINIHLLEYDINLILREVKRARKEARKYEWV